MMHDWPATLDPNRAVGPGVNRELLDLRLTLMWWAGRCLTLRWAHKDDTAEYAEACERCEAAAGAHRRYVEAREQGEQLRLTLE